MADREARQRAIANAARVVRNDSSGSVSRVIRGGPCKCDESGVVLMTGEHHERAVEAAEKAVLAEWFGVESRARSAIDAYHASLAKQGVRLVEQPKCAACDGEGRTQTGEACVPEGCSCEWEHCERCNGTGYVRLVDLREVVGFVREWQDDWNEGAMVPPPADALERRFGGNEGSEDETR